MSANRNPAAYGAPVSLTATVSPATATGRVTFYDETAVLGTAVVVSGAATMTTVMIPAGVHSVRARYSGDSSTSPATSVSYPEIVLTAPGDGFLTYRPLTPGVAGSFERLAVADFNGDGKLDLAREQTTGPGAGLEVLLGNGDGTFTPKSIPATASFSMLAAADFNGDGEADLLTVGVGSNGAVWTVFLGNGDGTFRALPSQVMGHLPQQPALADFDGDGIVDLAVVDVNDPNRLDAGTAALYLGQGDGTFGPPVSLAPGPAPYSIVTGDFNGDGIADLALTLLDDWRTGGPGHVSILLGKGDGTFSPPAIYAPGGTLLIADFDGDERLDLLIGSGATLTLLYGNGDGTFSTSPVPNIQLSGTIGLVTLDANGDGKPDLFTGYQVLFNSGRGQFTKGPSLGYIPSAFAWAADDFNGDGIADLVSEAGILFGAPPTHLRASLTPNGAIQLGQQGATFTITVSDSGSTSISGITTVVYNTPGDFNLSNMSGAGWTCMFAQCQRGDSLSPGQSFPAITVTVNVSVTPPPVVSHSVTLIVNSGTPVVTSATVPIVYPPPFDLSVSMSHPGNLQLGQSQITSTVVVNNLGPGASFGTVTVTVGVPTDVIQIDLSGSGWTCTALTCQRSDPLPFGQSYPPLTAEMFLSKSPAAILTTTAALTCFLDSNPANNQATDVVIVYHPQSIAFAPIADHAVNDRPFPLHAVASSGLPVSYLASGNCSIAGSQVTLLAVGMCSITASQSGSVAYSAADDVQRSFTIFANGSAVTLNVDSASSTFGKPVTLTATVTPTPAGGKVTFYDGVTVLGTAAVSEGSARLSTPVNATGKRTFIGHFSGDGSHPGSTSSAVSHVVTAVPSFTFASISLTVSNGLYTGGAAVGDLNGDGWPDIVTDVGVLLNNGAGGFGSAASLPYQASWPVLADFNGDGVLDLVSAAVNLGAVYFLPGHGDGTFGAPVTFPAPIGPIVVADFNLDGIPDLAVVDHDTGAVAILLGSGDGTFFRLGEVPFADGLSSISVGDLNGDGAADLVTVVLEGPTVPQHPRIVALLGNGDGSFGTPTVTRELSVDVFYSGLDLALDDLNGDGRLDILVKSSGSPPFIALGNGDGTFGAPHSAIGPSFPGTPAAILTADFNGDSNEDFVPLQSGFGPLPVPVFFGSGDGTLQTAATMNPLKIDSPTAPIPLADLNGDGRVDFVVRSQAQPGILLVEGAPGASLQISATHRRTVIPTLAREFMILVSNAAGATGATGTVTLSVTGSDPEVSFALVGAGWSCSQAACTRSDPLAPGNSYPPVIATYNVPTGRTAPVGVSATVSGDGLLSRSAMDTAPIGAISDDCTDPFAPVRTRRCLPRPCCDRGGQIW